MGPCALRAQRRSYFAVAYPIGIRVMGDEHTEDGQCRYALGSAHSVRACLFALCPSHSSPWPNTAITTNRKERRSMHLLMFLPDSMRWRVVPVTSNFGASIPRCCLRSHLPAQVWKYPSPSPSPVQHSSVPHYEERVDQMWMLWNCFF